MEQNPYVIIRTSNAGVHIGNLVSKEVVSGGYAVKLKDSRRIWSWGGANCLNDLGINGPGKPSDCSFSQRAPYNELFAIEILYTTEKGEKGLDSIPDWFWKDDSQPKVE